MISLRSLVFRLADFGPVFAPVHDVFDGRLGRDPALGEGARGEFVGGAADGIAGTEQPLYGHHPVVSPLVFRRGVILRAARPGS